ncbi:unnamed protein product [Pieris brassicae]|uniref:Uncharacterized protein n=1 Tax=Pieris brassicae TaxID=7116 RepID=A0A9P0WTV5_PIEBR|nr:unnamed protein product [Pieris brassicae]
MKKHRHNVGRQWKAVKNHNNNNDNNVRCYNKELRHCAGHGSKGRGDRYDGLSVDSVRDPLSGAQRPRRPDRPFIAASANQLHSNKLVFISHY